MDNGESLGSTIKVEDEREWAVISPALTDDEQKKLFTRYARSLAAASSCTDIEKRKAAETARGYFAEYKDDSDYAALRASVLIIADLVEQGWECRLHRGAVQLRQPKRQDEVGSEQQRVRRQLHLERNRQLSERATRDFLLYMEQPRTFNGRTVSVFSLMRDGAELARLLRNVQSGDVDVRNVIRPYLQVVAADAVCEHTGYRLMDIWRYFRHTWANPYRSVPGRSLALLIRDAAAPNHAVIGISALASSALQIGNRDRWIGWEPESVVSQLRQGATAKHVTWLFNLVRKGIEELHVDDLLSQYRSPLGPKQLQQPTEEVISWLVAYAHKKREQHHSKPDRKAHKQSFASDKQSRTAHWWAQAETLLFKSKRAETLALLLRAQMVLAPDGKKVTPEQLKDALGSPDKRQAIQSLIRKAKSERVGICMADISVCGAIPPYSQLLGGKLVAMMVTSPELILEYKERYKRAESVIASSLAARPIIRVPELVFLGTTSLYGTEPTQYTRVSVPSERVGGQPGSSVSYHRIGKTEGYGTLHFSEETADAIASMVTDVNGNVRVNNIFGEGASPRLRAIRDGLDMLAPEYVKVRGKNSDALLSHGSARVVYGVALAKNVRDYLLGIDKQPDYIAPLSNAHEASRMIGEWWAERWLKPRLQKPGLLEEVASHTGTKHGAKVRTAYEPGAIAVSTAAALTAGD